MHQLRVAQTERRLAANVAIDSAEGARGLAATDMASSWSLPASVLSAEAAAASEADAPPAASTGSAVAGRLSLRGFFAGLVLGDIDLNSYTARCLLEHGSLAAGSQIATDGHTCKDKLAGATSCK